DTTISRLINYLCVPALIINSFKTHCTPTNLVSNLSLILYCAGFITLTTIIAYILAPKFAQKEGEAGIYRYSIAVTNFGFMGNALVQGLLGEEMLFKYLVFCLPLNILVYSIGVGWLTGDKKGKKFSLKSLLNPTFLYMLIGMLIGLLQIPLPAFFGNALAACGNCFSPLAMILTGIVIGKFNLKGLVLRYRVYILTALRLVIMPLCIFGLTVLLKLPHEAQLLVMISQAMPLGLNTIVFPAAYGGDETLGASMAVISNVIGILTVPLMMSLVI
ncbi:MAG: AEC family transporter, partial [Oscillospiraceae bacterium]|nr:AEC family transporter [Oscillospiraceae bacterium]